MDFRVMVRVLHARIHDISVGMPAAKAAPELPYRVPGSAAGRAGVGLKI
jgi:hypothetical protein